MLYEFKLIAASATVCHYWYWIWFLIFTRRACFIDFLLHLSDPKAIKDATEMHFCYAKTALLSYLVFGGVVYLRS